MLQTKINKTRSDVYHGEVPREYIYLLTLASLKFNQKGFIMCGMITKNHAEAMIGSNGRGDGNINKMLLKINNGKQTASNYSGRMVMVGGGLQ